MQFWYLIFFFFPNFFLISRKISLFSNIRLAYWQKEKRASIIGNKNNLRRSKKKKEGEMNTKGLKRRGKEKKKEMQKKLQK